MKTRRTNRLNWLERNLPEGLVATASWLTKHGYPSSRRSKYVKAGWLEQPTRGVYGRTRGKLSWQQVVISLQALLHCPLVIGGRTALEVQGYGHYLPQETREVHLYGSKQLPKWVNKIGLKARFVYHNDRKLFRDSVVNRVVGLDWSPEKDGKAGGESFAVQEWGQWQWPLTLSTPERAILELLDEVPSRESFHQADALMEGLANLSPRRLQTLLEDCRNVKVKRLFFFFADRHQHAWLKRIDRSPIEMGEGKRMLVKGGKLNKAYQITVPDDFDGIR
jgi:hypothetical protein